MQMIALKPTRYQRRRYMPGAVFAVRGMTDARLLAAIGAARIHVQPVVSEPLPVAAPMPMPELPVMPVPPEPEAITVTVEHVPLQPPEEPQEPVKPRRSYRRRDVEADKD